ncbi:MAG: zinc ribbon domain-containing protein [Thermoguttaceae bacterium]|nr:zinc ribbon domain-containing protein [Thermoguttaceae bacterium]MBR5757815.1 zinc ribbon domain-containing protein [Thermoguttaceae bacterium]
MPTYEYHCDGCGKDVEIFHSMSAKPAEICPECGAKKLRRLISEGAGIIFKGHGFYCTDYKSSPSEASVSQGSGESSESKSAESSSDAKKSEKPSEKPKKPEKSSAKKEKK